MITDAEEGLILVNVDTLADGNPRNNFIKRAVTWNPGGVLNGARHVTLAGSLRLHHGRFWSGRRRSQRAAEAAPCGEHSLLTTCAPPRFSSDTSG